MSSDIEKLENKIKELEGTIEALTNRCDVLEWRLLTLAISKIPDPRYPFWNWILSHGMPEETRLRLTALLSALQGRVTGTQLPSVEEKIGISGDLLTGSGPPRAEEVLAAIKSITGMQDNRQIADMLRAVNDQGMFQELCEHVLSSLDVVPVATRENSD